MTKQFQVQGFFLIGKTPLTTSAFWLLLPSIMEIGQKYHVLGGTYDPKDFLAYGLGVGLAYSIDRFSFRTEK